MKTTIKWIVGIVIIAAFAWFVVPLIPTVKPTETSSSSTQKLEATYPEPTDYAVDSAGVLTPDQLSNLNSMLKGIDNGTRQYGVLIVKTTAPLSIEQYGIKLAEKWKVGHETLDNGAIIIVATEDRKVRLEIGYGLEQYIPDSVAGRIIDEKMISSLKINDWYNAILGAINGLEEKIK